MGRIYKVTFSQVSVSGVQDLIQVKGNGKVLKIRRVYWGVTNTTLPTSQMSATRCRFLGASVTDGSGGSTPTPAPIKGDAAATFLALANNTTKASSSTAVVHLEHGDHLYNGFERAWADAEQPVVGTADSFVLELLSAPLATVTMSGGIEVEELG